MSYRYQKRKYCNERMQSSYKKITLESENPRVMEEKRREGTQRALFRVMVARKRSTTSPLRLSAVPHDFGQI